MHTLNKIFFIVYDTYHPVVDYTNLIVVGITGALAWELPTKPVYPDEELQEIYKNGSLPLLRRNDGDVEMNYFRIENTTGMLLSLNCAIRGRYKDYDVIVNVQLNLNMFNVVSSAFLSRILCTDNLEFRNYLNAYN